MFGIYQMQRIYRLYKSHCHVLHMFPLYRTQLGFLLMIKLLHHLLMFIIGMAANPENGKELQNLQTPRRRRRFPRATHRLPNQKPQSLRFPGKMQVLQMEVLQVHALRRSMALWLHLVMLTGQSSKPCQHVFGLILTNMVNTVTP